MFPGSGIAGICALAWLYYVIPHEENRAKAARKCQRKKKKKKAAISGNRMDSLDNKPGVIGENNAESENRQPVAWLFAIVGNLGMAKKRKRASSLLRYRFRAANITKK